MIVRKPSSQFTTSSTSSRKSSLLYPPSALEDWDADDEDTMSADDFVPSRPLSVRIPKVSGAEGPYCPRRPNLREILANTSPAPWTLAAFMAYLSNNHCLETLEFTMDAGRYRKHYNKMMSKASDAGKPPTKDVEYVQQLWERLIDAYIQPNGSREVNLPSEVRDPILAIAPASLPPAPEKLDPAVAKIYELMEESVLVPFLNSCYPQSAHPTISSCPYDTSEESIPMSARTFEDRSAYTRRNRHARSSPPPRTAVQPISNSYSPSSSLNRKSAPSNLTTALTKSRLSAKLSPSTSAPAAPLTTSASGTSSGSDANNSSSGPGMIDDSGSTPSPINESPMTPPTSPHMSDVGSSPRHSRDSGMWKKLGRLSGTNAWKMGKRKSQGALKDEPQ